MLGRRRRPKLMEKFLIEGGVPLSGTMVPAGNKNGALPILAASLLTDEEVVVRNVPRIRDVDAMLAILRAIGVEVSWRGQNEVALRAAGVSDCVVEQELAELIRASFLLAGPLLARFGRAVMSPPGGDVIGRRRLDPHLTPSAPWEPASNAGGTSCSALRGGCSPPTSSWTSPP